MITLRTALATALTIAALALAPTSSQAAPGGKGIKTIAPIAQTARATGVQGVTGSALSGKRRCKFVSTPYPHVECTF